VPDQIVFVPALPRTSVGKLDKKVLREQFRDHAAAPSASAVSGATRASPVERPTQYA
jgi:acyl-CoA synthetase (AMP-forming)/AMP-acid ligase II